jgi:hypothetical protein
VHAGDTFLPFIKVGATFASTLFTMCRWTHCVEVVEVPTPRQIASCMQAGGAMLARSVLLLGTKTMASAASTR